MQNHQAWEPRPGKTTDRPEKCVIRDVIFTPCAPDPGHGRNSDTSDGVTLRASPPKAIASVTPEAPITQFVMPARAVPYRGSGFGIFNLISGGARLPASVIARALWSAIGPSATFLAGARFAATAAIGIVTLPSRTPRAN